MKLKLTDRGIDQDYKHKRNSNSAKKKKIGRTNWQIQGMGRGRAAEEWVQGRKGGKVYMGKRRPGTGPSQTKTSGGKERGNPRGELHQL